LTTSLYHQSPYKKVNVMRSPKWVASQKSLRTTALRGR
ncbi:hypothetical protein T09_11801, partial [Trichinella sp. T9]